MRVACTCPMRIGNQSKQQHTTPLTAKDLAFFENLPKWTCHVFVPLQPLVQATCPSKTIGFFHPILNSAARISKVIDVLRTCHLGLPASVPPDWFSFEECLDGGVVIAIAPCRPSTASCRIPHGFSGRYANSIGCPCRGGKCSPWAASERR